MPVAVLAIFVEVEVPKRAGGQVEAGRHRTPARYQQGIPGNDKSALRADPGEGGVAVGLVHPLGAGAVVAPDDLAGLGVEGVDEGPHEGPNAGREVDPPVLDHGAAAGGPRRDKPAIAEDLAIRGAASEAPPQRARGGLEAIEAAVVAREQDRVVGRDGG